jgi:radical SAM superfamily enzyme with C-terminal helix-hairpin-helix motif
MEFILRRIGRPTLGQRSRLERDFQEYLDELKILGETKKYAHRRYRESQMGRSGTVYSFGSNHFGQVPRPCSSLLVVFALAAERQ